MFGLQKKWSGPKARHTRFIVLHQSLTQFVCEQAVIIYYSLLASAIYIR